MTTRTRIVLTRPRRTQKSDFSKTTNSEQEKKFGGLNPLPPSYGGEVGFIRHAELDNKTTNKVDELLNQARLLTAKQRQELLDQLSLANKITRSAGHDRDLDMWVQGIHDALVDGASVSDGSVYGKLLIKQTLSVSQAWRPIVEFMEQSKLSELKVVERTSVYYMLAELLVQHARKISERTGVPLGPKLIGNCAPGIAGVFDLAFPGYLRAGLAKVAARQLVVSRA